MCLAIPGKIVSLEGERGVADFMGVEREVVLTFVPQAKRGDYVLVHAGFAIEVLDRAEAEKTLAVWRELLRRDVAG